jgi:hypothetical protein
MKTLTTDFTWKDTIMPYAHWLLEVACLCLAATIVQFVYGT